MDRVGIYSQIMYPNVLGFATYAFMKLDPELSLECVTAYNDWQLEYCGVNLDRLVPLVFVPYWDIEAAVKEVERCLNLGYRGVNCPWNMPKAGLPRLADPHWTPLLELIQASDVTLNFHIGTGQSTEDTNKRKLERTNMLDLVQNSTVSFMANATCITELITTEICHRYPRLKMVSVESGFGYLPYLLEALDWQFLNVGGQHQFPDMLMPSEYFERQIYASFWFERHVGRSIDLLPNNVMFETDFPHPSGLTEGKGSAALSPRETIQFHLADIPTDTLGKVLSGTAAELYHIDLSPAAALLP